MAARFELEVWPVMPITAVDFQHKALHTKNSVSEKSLLINNIITIYVDILRFVYDSTPPGLNLPELDLLNFRKTT